jgi:transcriptional regulator with XRE-family HTH domain
MFRRRLKAAMALADMTAAELAVEVRGELMVGQRTVERIMAGKRAPRPWEVARFAEALGVPEEFLLHGPRSTPSDGSVADSRVTLESLDRRLGSLEADVAEAVRLAREALELLRAAQRRTPAELKSPLATEQRR